MDMKCKKGDFFLDKNTYTVYIFDGNEWWEVVPDSYLKKLIGLNDDK
jgi:hypothetical protein